MISIRLWMHLDFSTDGKVVRSNGKRWFPDRTTPELTTKLAHPLFVRDSEAPRECLRRHHRDTLRPDALLACRAFSGYPHWKWEHPPHSTRPPEIVPSCASIKSNRRPDFPCGSVPR